MSTFECIVTNMTVSLENFDKWKKMLKVKTTPLLPVYTRLFRRYGANTTDEYISIIKKGIENNTILELTTQYESIKSQEMAENLEKEKKSLEKKILNSKKTISDNITIRMLSDKDEKEAANLYILFKKTMGEDIEKSVEYTQDFILKNIMFGIFVNTILAGFVIIQYEKLFLIDEHPDERIKTFYIQELLIHPEYRGQKLSKYLIEYCIMRCPKEQKYISLMTMPANIPLIKIAQSCGFIIQNFPSGDSKHSLLLIRNMDKVERTITSPKN